MNVSSVYLLFFVFLVKCMTVKSLGNPNIVFIIADDLGWNDVSFHGSNQILTPNLDALAYNGIILNSHYVQATSTPTRTALFTGKYPLKLGMQGPSLMPGEPRGLPPEKILPQYLKELGYSTHLIGKWDLGYSFWNQTPTYRGFDTHLGYFNNYVSYYDYINTDNLKSGFTGYDLRQNTDPIYEHQGEYATDVFTNHAVDIIKRHDLLKPLFLMISHLAPHAANEGKMLEAPQEAINKFRHIADGNRRTYAAMVSKLDDSVGSIMSALQSRDMLDNTIVVFMSDNGAPAYPSMDPFRNWGSNQPLRGSKHTLFEGGVRVTALVFSNLIPQRPRVSNELMHVSDWLPTLVSAAGGDVTAIDIDVDGIDQWPTFAYDLPSARNDILLNIDEETRNAGLRFYNWKLIVGTSYNGTYNTYFGEKGTENIYQVDYNLSAVYESPAGTSIEKAGLGATSPEIYEELRRQATLKCLSEKSKKNPCDPSDAGKVCLYDIPNDPCEENDLSNFFPSVVRRMKRALVDYRTGLVEQLNKVSDLGSNPMRFNYTWSPWLDGCENNTPC